MKKLLLTMTALAAFAAPAAAQTGYQDNMNARGGMGMQNRIAQLDARFQAGVQSGAITRQEARALQPQLRQLRQLEWQYSRDGLSQQERQDLQQRIRYVRQQLRAADGGVGDRYTGWDNDDVYGRDGRYGRTDGNYGRNDGYYGRNDGYYGQGGSYEEVSEVCGTRSSAGGIGGIIGSILGGGDNCLSVGERATGNLGAVPYQYRDQFRDGGGYYYRYTNGRVVQIDARTQTVVRIYDVQN